MSKLRGDQLMGEAGNSEKTTGGSLSEEAMSQILCRGRRSIPFITKDFSTNSTTQELSFP